MQAILTHPESNVLPRLPGAGLLNNCGTLDLRLRHHVHAPPL